MIVSNLYVVGVALFPAEADPPLVVDADAVLTDSIAVKFLRSVPRERKITQAGALPISCTRLPPPSNERSESR